MRKVITIIMLCAVLCGCSLLGGCTDGSQFGDPGAAKVEETERPTRFRITELPFTMDYNGKSITCKSVELYQSQVNYEWHPYMIIRFDTSDLTEEDIHWLTTADFSVGIKPKDLDVDAHYYSEQNDISYEYFPQAVEYTNSDTHELVDIFYQYDEGTRKDFSDIEVAVSISLTQEEKHEVDTRGKIQEENYVYTYDFQINGDDEDGLKRDVRPDTDITEEERGMFERGLANIAKRYGLTG